MKNKQTELLIKKIKRQNNRLQHAVDGIHKFMELKLEFPSSTQNEDIFPEQNEGSVLTSGNFGHYTDSELVSLVIRLQEEIRMKKRAESNNEIENLVVAILKENSDSVSLFDGNAKLGRFLLEASQQTSINSYFGLCSSEVAAERANLYAKFLSMNQTRVAEGYFFTEKALSMQERIFVTPNFDNELDEAVVAKLANMSEFKVIREMSSYSQEWLYVVKTIDTLLDEGMGFVLMPNSALSSVRDENLRMRIFSSGDLWAVIKLPERIVLERGSQHTLLIIKKGYRGPIRMVDASNEFDAGQSRKKAYFSSENLKNVVTMLNTNSKFSMAIDASLVQEKFYNLSVIEYLDDLESQLKNPVELMSVAKVFRGRPFDKDTIGESDTSEPGGYLLSVADVGDGYIDKLSQELSANLVAKSKKFSLHEDDIVMTSRGSILKMAMVTKKQAGQTIILSSNLVAIRSNDINPFYLFGFLKSELGRKLIERTMTGSNMVVISNKQLERMLVDLPDEATQEVIGSIVSRLCNELNDTVQRTKDVQLQLGTVIS